METPPDAGGLDRHHASVGAGDPAAAAPVPRHDRRKPRRARHQDRRLAVSALSRRDQSVRRAARDRRPRDFRRRDDRPRPDGARFAAERGRAWRRPADDDRRPFGGHRAWSWSKASRCRSPSPTISSCRCSCAARAADARGAIGRHRLGGAVRAARGDSGRAVARLCLYPARQRRGAGFARPVVLRRGRADRAGLSRRPVLAARQCARRGGGNDRRLRSIWLYTLLLPSLETQRRLRRFPRAWAAGDRLAAAGGLVRLDLQPAGQRRVRSACRRQYRRFRRLLADAGKPTRSSAMQANVFVGDAPTAKAQAFRLWRASATAGELEATVGALSRRRARAQRAGSVHGRARPAARGRRARPTRISSATPNICWPRRSAARRRGWCCRCCSAGARCRASRR